MFEGVVYIGDSCCNTGVLVHQCHPDAEMPCQFKWEMYYESGDPAAVLRALLRDLGVEVKKLIILERKLKMAEEIIEDREAKRDEMRVQEAGVNASKANIEGEIEELLGEVQGDLIELKLMKNAVKNKKKINTVKIILMRSLMFKN